MSATSFVDMAAAWFKKLKKIQNHRKTSIAEGQGLSCHLQTEINAIIQGRRFKGIH